MTSTFDSTGITVDRYADILTRLIALAEAEWGESIDTSEDEFLGHQYRVLSLLLGELCEILQDVYDSGSVSNATGVRLGNLVELIGLEYQGATYSTATVTLTATKACTVQAGSLYSTAAGVDFATDEELVFAAAGDDDVAVTCTITGVNNAADGEISVKTTAVSGITVCTNALAATPGRAQETAAELKVRHTAAVATSGDSDAASIYEAVTEVSGVSAAYIHDNDTDETVDGVPAHTIHVSAIGGTAADIAAAIDNTKTSGVPTYGSTATDVYNATTKQTKEINHSVAVEDPVVIAMTLTKIAGVYPDDGDDQIKAGLVAMFDAISINDDVYFNALYNPIYAVPGHNVSALTIDGAGADLTSSALIRYTVTTSGITIA